MQSNKNVGYLFNDRECFLVFGNEAADIPCYPGWIVSLGLQQITSNVHEVNTYTKQYQILFNKNKTKQCTNEGENVNGFYGLCMHLDAFGLMH